MATNQDFDALIARIDTATTTLENSVAHLADDAFDLSEAVADAQQAVLDAEQAVVDSQQQAQNASTSATEAEQAYTLALAQVDAATALVQALEEAVVIEEAPVNGLQYARQDGEWAVVAGGGGGDGVVSVNNILPDASGNVELDIPDEQVNSDWNATEGKAEILNKPTLFSGDYEDLTNKPTLFSGDYNDLTNTPTIPTQGVVSVVAGDNITVDNTDPLNPVISSEGGGGEAQGYPLELPANQSWTYRNEPLTHWPDDNPHNPIELSELRAFSGGRSRVGAEILTRTDLREAFPVGTFYVSSSDDPVGSTGGLMRVTWSAEINDTLIGKTFRFTPEPDATSGDASPDYIAGYSSGSLVWKPVGGEGSGSGGVTSVNNELPDAQGNVTIEVPTLTSQLTNDSGFITAAEVPAGGIEEAPNDGKQYARQNEGWTEVETGGGGSELGFPLSTVVPGLTYNNEPFTHWPHTNPHEPILMHEVRYDHNGTILTGREIIEESRTVASLLPAGRYFLFGDQNPDPQGSSGVMEVQKVQVSTSTLAASGFKCIVWNTSQPIRVGYYTSSTNLVWANLPVA